MMGPTQGAERGPSTRPMRKAPTEALTGSVPLELHGEARRQADLEGPEEGQGEGREKHGNGNEKGRLLREGPEGRAARAASTPRSV